MKVFKIGLRLESKESTFKVKLATNDVPVSFHLCCISVIIWPPLSSILEGVFVLMLAPSFLVWIAEFDIITGLFLIGQTVNIAHFFCGGLMGM